MSSDNLVVSEAFTSFLSDVQRIFSMKTLGDHETTAVVSADNFDILLRSVDDLID